MINEYEFTFRWCAKRMRAVFSQLDRQHLLWRRMRTSRGCEAYESCQSCEACRLFMNFQDYCQRDSKFKEVERMPWHAKSIQKLVCHQWTLFMRDVTLWVFEKFVVHCLFSAWSDVKMGLSAVRGEQATKRWSEDRMYQKELLLSTQPSEAICSLQIVWDWYRLQRDIRV